MLRTARDGTRGEGLAAGRGGSHLVKQRLDIVVSLGERPAPFCGGGVAPLTPDAAGTLAQRAPLGEPMQQRIERSGADVVAVPAKLFDEASPSTSASDA